MSQNRSGDLMTCRLKMKDCAGLFNLLGVDVCFVTFLDQPVLRPAVFADRSEKRLAACS